MKPTIQHLTNKQLIGMSEAMSLVEDKTGQLFRTFMPRRKEIPNLINADTFDLRVYPEDYYQPFNPAKLFTKWALAEVSKVEAIPEGMEVFHLIGGQYAVFHYKGLSADQRIFKYIFMEWLPQSDYVLTDLPHFEVLGEKTKLNDPNSEEEIWIPVRAKE